jgi:hypothetical protein
MINKKILGLILSTVKGFFFFSGTVQFVKFQHMPIDDSYKERLVSRIKQSIIL